MQMQYTSKLISLDSEARTNTITCIFDYPVKDAKVKDPGFSWGIIRSSKRIAIDYIYS